MSKKIIIDLSFITTNYNSGVAKYAYRFIEYLTLHNIENEFCLLVNFVAYDHFRATYPQFEMYKLGKLWMDKLGFFKKIAFALEFRKVVNNIDSDLIFCPWTNPINALSTKQKKIATIHDLQIRIDSKNYKQRDVWLQNFADSNIIKHAFKVLTISEYSKAQILKYFPDTTEKLLDCSNCVSLSLKEDVAPIKPGYDYLLYVGRMDAMKNVLTLVRAFNEIKDIFPHLNLVLVSTAWGYYEKKIKPFVESHGLINRITKVVNCSDEELVGWYKGTSLFVFPSLREGFGFPPIEAAYLNIPVLTSKADSLEEVTLGLLNYYEPATDSKALAARIVECLNNPPSIEQLEEIKSKYIKHYSVEVFGKRIYELLKKYNQ